MADQEWLDLIRQAEQDGAPEWLLAMLRELRGVGDPFALETYRRLLMDWAQANNPGLLAVIARVTTWLVRNPGTAAAVAGGEAGAAGAAAETEAATGSAAAGETATGGAAAGGTSTAAALAPGLIAALAWFSGLALAASKLGDLSVQWKSPCQEQYEDLVQMWAAYELDRETNTSGTKRQRAMKNLGKVSDMIGRSDGALLRCGDARRDKVVRKLREMAEADRDKWLDVLAH